MVSASANHESLLRAWKQIPQSLQASCLIVHVVTQGGDGAGKVREGAELARWSLMFLFGQKKLLL